jgi:DNA-binding CsgD family transcriptional regulator
MSEPAPHRQRPRANLTEAVSRTQVMSLAERLRSEGGRIFVGRAAEIAQFRQLLVDSAQSFLFLQGPVGVGKSALLTELQIVATSAGHRAFLIHAQQLGRDSTLNQELLNGLGVVGAPNSAGRGVLLVDDFEGERDQARLLELARALAADVLVVLASRTRVPVALRLGGSWSSLSVERELLPLTRSEGARLLELRGVPEEAHRDVLEFAEGFPLALALAANEVAKSPADGFTLERLQEAQHELGQLVCPLPPCNEQQLALDACAVALTLTADLLEEIRRAVQVESGAQQLDAFNWLARQNFVDSTRDGLRPHALVRIALSARLRRDRPRRYQSIHQVLRDAAISALAADGGAGPALSTLVFLDRDVPGVRHWAPRLDGPLRSMVPALPEEHTSIQALLRRTEGPESASLAEEWREQGCGEFEVLRGQGVDAFLCVARFDARFPLARLPRRDPAVAALRRYVDAHPLAEGEESFVFRWSLDAERYQSPSPRGLALTGRQTQLVLTTPSLPYSFCVMRDLEEWTPFWSAIGLPWQIVERFRVGNHDYSLLVFEWRRRPLKDVLARPKRSNDVSNPQQDSPGSFDELRVEIGERVHRLARKANLTPREVEILEQLCLGHSADTVARNLSIRPRTVKFHQENLLRKTGATSRVDLLRKLL